MPNQHHPGMRWDDDGVIKLDAQQHGLSTKKTFTCMEGACRRLSPNRFFVIGLGLGLFINVLSIKSMNRLQLLSLIVCFCKHSNRVELLFSRLISLTIIIFLWVFHSHAQPSNRYNWSTWLPTYPPARLSPWRSGHWTVATQRLIMQLLSGQTSCTDQATSSPPLSRSTNTDRSKRYPSTALSSVR